MTEHAPDLDVTHARQARRGRHALIILVCSLGLVVIAFAAVFTFYYGGLSGLHGNREAEPEVARAQDTTPAPVKQTPDAQTPDAKSTSGG